MISLSIFSISQAQNSQQRLLVGTYTKNCESDGIYIYDYATDGTAKLLSSGKKIVNPSYLAVSPDRKNVYAVNENGKESRVSAFSFDAKSGKIKKLNDQESKGEDPCYVLNDDKNVIAANYSGGSISVFKKNADGSLNPAIQNLKHEGHSIHPDRQEKPHVHMVQFSPDEKFVIANDLGTDRIYVYRYAKDSGKQVLEFQDTIPIKTGSGPRQLRFSPNGEFAYLLAELDGTLTSFHYKEGKFKRIQESSIVNPDFKGETSAADLRISADGKFLYATNRGDANTISLFAIQPSGKLTFKSTVSTLGKGPRNFAIDPSGKHLLVAHEKSNDIVIFDRDMESGELTDSGKRISVCSPVCLVFVNAD